MTESTNPKLPETLFHYTTAANLLAILQQRELWLTEHRFLNDRDEHKFYQRLISNALGSIDLEESLALLDQSENRSELRARFMSNLGDFRAGRMGPSFDTPMGLRLFVFSLSEVKDSLAQWRAYGNGEVCIEVRTTAFNMLPRLDHMMRYRLSKVTYAADDHVDNDLLNKVREMISNAVATGVRGGGIPQIFLSGGDIVEPLFTKHLGFEAEREWRLVLECVPQALIPGKSLRVSGRHLVPYFKLPIVPERDIAGIIFGPDSDPSAVDWFRQAVREVVSFPVEQSPFAQMRIERSAIPYRA